MKDRFEKNINIVKEISSIFGLKLLRCDPHWPFVRFEVGGPPIELIASKEFYTIHDDFMGRLALVL